MNKIFTYIRLYPKIVWFYSLLLFIPVIRKTFFNRKRDMDAFASIDSNNIISVFVTIAIIFILIYHFNTIRNKIHPKVSSFSIYYFFSLISFIWAGIDKLPFIGYKAIEVLASFYFIGFILLKINDKKKILKFIILMTTLITTFEMIHIWFDHSNTSTFTAMLGVLLCLGTIKYRILKWKDVRIMLMICLIGVYTGSSSASNIALLVGLIILFGSGKKGINVLYIIILLVLFYVLYLYFNKEIFDLLFPNKSQEELENLTGRTVMWDLYWKGFLRSPILGYGFCYGEKNLIAFGSFGDYTAIGSAHNMFISVLIGNGIVGLIIWLRFIIKLLNITYVRASIGDKYASMLFPVFIAMFVNANSFPAIGSEWSYVGNVCYALIILGFWDKSFKTIQNHKNLIYKTQKIKIQENIEQYENSMG